MILDLEAFRRQVRDGPSCPVQIEPQPTPAPQIYLLDRVLQAAMVYRHVLDDRATGEELFRIVDAAFHSGQIVAKKIHGQTLQNRRNVLNQN